MSISLKQSVKQLGIVYNIAYGVYTYYLKCKKLLKIYYNRERRYSFGDENADKTFYVIGVNHTTAGLFAIVKSVFCHIFYAVKKGYIPVVDMENFKSQLSEGTNGGNAWESYFEQPCGYNLKDISKSKNIIRSASLPFPNGVEIGFDTLINTDFYDKYHSSFIKYIRPCPAVRQYIETKYKSIINNHQRIIGVLVRGTDYVENHPKGHPIQPTMPQALAKVKQIMDKYDYRNVFLATEDKNIYNYFKDTFGDKLLFSGQKLYSGMNGKKFLSEMSVSDYSEKWQDIVNYYASIHILSKCEGLSAGLTCGSICAYLISDSFRHVHFWNLGKYN